MSISIVTISFNQAKFLPECLSSVTSQLHSGDMYVVVDPGSKDRSREIVSEVQRCSPQMKVIFEPDLGPGDGLNKGFRNTNSEILGYLNSDDFLLPGCLSYVRSFFDSHPNVDVLIGGIKWTNAESVLNKRGRVPERFSLKKFVNHNLHYFQQGTFFRKSIFEAVGGFNNNNRTCWDFELVIDMALRGAKIEVTSKPLGAFRVHDLSITGKGDNTTSYLADIARLKEKVIRSGIKPSGPLMRYLWKIEHRLNPLRVIKQFRPV